MLLRWGRMLVVGGLAISLGACNGASAGDDDDDATATSDLGVRPRSLRCSVLVDLSQHRSVHARFLQNPRALLRMHGRTVLTLRGRFGRAVSASTSTSDGSVDVVQDIACEGQQCSTWTAGNTRVNADDPDELIEHIQ